MRFFLTILMLMAHQLLAQELVISDPVSFLALGDSYTIGQGVLESERWPEQLGEQLREEGLEVQVEIIARTGWTTADLIQAMDNNPPKQTFYNLVALLIGVNNQFQRRGQDEYRTEFERLLIRAINLARGERSNVMVISIPDYGFTPFGQSYSNVSAEIDQFNAINESITNSYSVPYINITDISRRGLAEPDLVASDGLHPSGIMYAEWVQRIMQRASLERTITSIINTEEIYPKVYPNPAGHQLNIPIHSETLITIYSSSGSVFGEFKAAQNISIDLSAYPAGSYLIRKVQKNVTTTEAFIKN